MAGALLFIWRDFKSRLLAFFFVLVSFLALNEKKKRPRVMSKNGLILAAAVREKKSFVQQDQNFWRFFLINDLILICTRFVCCRHSSIQWSKSCSKNGYSRGNVLYSSLNKEGLMACVLIHVILWKVLRLSVSKFLALFFLSPAFRTVFVSLPCSFFGKLQLILE